MLTALAFALTQAVAPVTDLNSASLPESGFGSFPRGIGEGTGSVLLTAAGPWGGELYESDGTPQGTKLLADTLPGAAGANPQRALPFPDGRVFFDGNTGSGIEPFVTVPGELQAQSLGDLRPGPLSSSPSNFVGWSGEIWFLATDGSDDRELWRTDGTLAGTRLAEDLTAGGSSAADSDDAFLQVAGGRLFVGTAGPSDRLFVKDAPDAMPELLADFGAGGLDPAQAAEVGGLLVFSADDGASGLEPWVSDGTLAGTVRLVDLEAGVAGSAPEFHGVEGGRLWFSATLSGVGNEVFTTDGTSPGTALVAEIIPGMAGAFDVADVWPEAGRAWALVSSTQGLDERLFELDPTAGQASFLLNLTNASGGLSFLEGVRSAGQLVLVLDPPAFTQAEEVWVSDGTFAGTLPAANDLEWALGSSSTLLIGETPAGVLFRGNDAEIGAEPHIVSAGVPGYSLVADLRFEAETLDSNPSDVRRFRDGVLFRATDPAVGTELFFSDGTEAGTRLLLDYVPGTSFTAYRFLGELDGQFLFLVSAAGQQSQSRLYRTDGTPAGTIELALVPDDFQGEEVTFLLDGALLFGAADALWRTDGTPAGTWIVYSGLGDPIRSGAALDEVALFGNSPPGSSDDEVWITDGTAAGTGPLLDLFPGPFGSLPSEFVRSGDEILFSARSTSFTDYELWKSDGTEVGTTRVLDLYPGPQGSYPLFLTPFGGGLLFRATTPGNGTELFRTDGTAAGTEVVADLAPGPLGSVPMFLVESSERVYFTADSGTGRKLYWSDGIGANPVPVPSPSFPAPTSGEMSPFGTTSGLLFAVSDPFFGTELFRFLPGDPVASLVSDLVPAGLDSDPRDLVVVGDRILFAARDIQIGRELFGTSLSDQGGYLFDTLGTSCGSKAEAFGSAALGESFSVTADGGQPGGLANLYVGLGLEVSTVSGCVIWMESPFPIATSPVDAQGRTSFDFTVVPSPALIGLEAVFQVVIPQVGGPLFGALAISDAIELVVGP